jgi:hypothetical protein
MVKIMPTEIKELINLYNSEEIGANPILTFKVNDNKVFVFEDELEPSSFWCEIKKEDWEQIKNFIDFQFKK